MNWVRRTWDRAVWSWEAISGAARTEPSFRAWLALLAVSLAASFVLPLTAGERGLIAITGLLVLAAELFNTGIETAIDDISEEIRPLAKRAKDAACAAVALTAIAAAIAWIAALARLLAG